MPKLALEETMKHGFEQSLQSSARRWRPNAKASAAPLTIREWSGLHEEPSACDFGE